MNNIKKKTEQSRNPSEQSKKERRKKLARIKDTLHKGMGKKVFKGIGEGNRGHLNCHICREKAYTLTSEVIHGIIVNYCDKTSCRDEVEKLKRKNE
jgi:hypothetical protein